MDFVFALRDFIIERTKRAGGYRRVLAEITTRHSELTNIVLVNAEDTVSKIDLRDAGLQAKLSIGWRRASTSGTSGTPFLFPQPISALQYEQAYIDYIWRLKGFRTGKRCAVMRGVEAPVAVCKAFDRLIISCKGWSDQDIRLKNSALIEFNPQFIHCYPSVLDRYIRRSLALGLPLCNAVEGVFSGSEEITELQEAGFRRALGADTVAWYGQSEQVVLAVKDSGGCYAIVPGYSEVAFIARDGLYELVGRSIANPFFSSRWYRTGDYCENAFVGRSSILGCNTILLFGLHGRSVKNITLRDGRIFPLNHVIFGLHGAVWAIVERFCFVQKAPGVLLFFYSRNNEVLGSIDDLVDALRGRVPCDLIVEAVEKPFLSDVTASKWLYFYESIDDFRRAIGGDGLSEY